MDVYVMWPMPVRQADAYSSIAKKITQYNTTKWAREHRLLWYNSSIHDDPCLLSPSQPPLPPPIHTLPEQHRQCQKHMLYLRICVEFMLKRSRSQSKWPFPASPWNALYWCTQMDVYHSLCETYFSISIPTLLMLQRTLRRFFVVHNHTPMKITHSHICLAQFFPALFDAYTLQHFQSSFSLFHVHSNHFQRCIQIIP